MIAWYWIPIAVVATIVALCLHWAGDSTDAEDAALYRRQYDELVDPAREEYIAPMLARHKRERLEAGI